MKKISFFALTLLLICFIWHNSLVDAPHSTAVSRQVLAFLNRALAMLTISQPLALTEHLVRKAAHFTEFYFLGSALFSTFYAFGKRRTAFFLTVIIGGFVAVIDEHLQLYSPGRSSQVSDVFLDSGAVLTAATALQLFVYWLRKKK
ncbi:VanZ family protein [Megasphaera vaginalis (ex Bordigoni et al. 2020)]|uniref:VanZ family protein n=1 Tax=Megasphaera vaginalis (ex Bordigoni et al. 2020) TaxID=2045301 RepID=UPI000C7C732A|nr:VanZ family protein [Megasphaera vaginalis (ex Bordigoni et al. 2020)]